MVINLKVSNRWLMGGCLVTILLQPGIEVAGNTPMTQCISTVCRDVHLDEPVALQMIIFCGRLTNRSILRQYDDTRVVGTNTDLVLCTYHTTGIHATQLGFLDDELLVTVIQHAA